MFNVAGKTLGKYRLVEKLGQGGMAQIYKAYQPDLDRYVAIKILHPHLTADEAFALRFQREARAVAALDHPHIVRVYDFDTEDDLAFLVMEHLEGVSLRSMLHDLDCRDKLLELEEVERIVGALADALDHAHRRGIVHRDLKPSNVLSTPTGRPVLTDFGIARMVDTTVITESGGTLGTPAYMSPEQGQGESGDARSDIYALGVLLYQLCTGRVPFEGDTPYAVILKHITAPLPSPRSVRPELPVAVEKVILKALSKHPNDRYQAASELGRALRVAIGSPSSTPPDRRGVLTPVADRLRSLWTLRRQHSVLRGVGIVAATCFACLLLLWVTRPFRVRRFLARVTPPPTPVSYRDTNVLVLEGPDVVVDTWLNPDLPEETWHETDLVHLQGPLTPDRLLFRFDTSALPKDARVVSATLTLNASLWGDVSFPSAAVAYRVLTPWNPESTTYAAPWSAPGLAAGVDYDASPLDFVPMPDEGCVTFDVAEAVSAWQERGEPNCGLLIQASEDSHNQAHHWIQMSEQPRSADRPTLSISYEMTP